MEKHRDNTTLISGGLFLCLLVFAVVLFNHQRGAHPRRPEPNAPVSRQDLDESIATLEAAVKPALVSAKDPWALALGLRGVGPDFQLESQTLAERLFASAAPFIVKDQDDHYRFSETAQGLRVSPAPGALLAVLLESGAKLDRQLQSPSGAVDLTLLARTFVKEAKLATTDDEWTSFGWTLDALSLALSNQIEVELARQKLTAFSEAALEQLERANRVFRQWQGKGDVSAQAEHELRAALQERSGIYHFEGAGLHLMQALLRGNGVLRDPHIDRAIRRLVGTTLFRPHLEEPVWYELIESSPDQRPPLTATVDYEGRLLEVFGWTVLLTGAEDEAPTSSIEAPVTRTVADLVPHIKTFSAAARFAALRDGEPERYFAELGAASDALRGLHLVRRLNH